MTHGVRWCIFLSKFNQVQTISKLKWSGHGNICGEKSSHLRGVLSIPDNSLMGLKSETKFTVRLVVEVNLPDLAVSLRPF